ncbi:TonB-dependent receptor plug domain-containing protein [Pedobacter metabolipauper]|uniref:Outer membrane receptor for ferrienterochelin and colicins n=1 Tax=Pedobacter metabolipauper TaxID=425513 RepID=A0A4R6SX60_9SPHI|nr:TonB-dependent receptor [Pedobacter metabolipauper]TDQ08752.1 outer membrane receptor for ferrienterochelin and colicins [Pedobacter metabolipauper]
MKSFLPAVILSFLVFNAGAQQDKTSPVRKITADSLLKLQEVVITGQFEPQSLKKSVYNVRVINSQMIKLRAATDLKTILSTELGIRFSNDPATGISDPQLMGMDGAGIKILLDGVPMADRGTAKESLAQIDVNTIERIEIVEGPMSVMYGTDAMAGVINIITKRITGNQLSVNARLQEESAGTEYSAFNKGGTHNGNLGVNWQNNAWRFGLSATRNNFGGWQGDHTGRAKEWLPKDQWLGTALAGYKMNNLDVWYRFNGTDETLHYLGDIITNNGAPIASDKKYLSKRFFHQAQADLTVNDKLSFNAAASYTDYSRRTQSTNLNLNTGSETLSIDPGSQDKDVFSSTFFRGTALYKLSPSVSLQPGIEYNNNSGKGARIQGDPVINDYSFFISSQIQLNPAIQLRPGLRFLNNSVYDAPPVIPSLNAKVRLNEQLDLRFAYARGFRAPILRELYFIFKDSSHDIVGNENLKAEHSNSFNGSLAWALKSTASVRLSTILSGFYNEFKNRIDIGTDAAVSNSSVYINIGKFKTTGAEWNNTLNIKNVQASLGLSYIGRYNQYSEQPELGDSPSFTWSPELNTNIIYSFPKLDANIGFFYKFTGRYQQYTTSLSSGQNTVILGEVASYHLADLTLNKSVNNFITINAGARNLFDVSRLNTTGTNTDPHSPGGSVAMGYGRSFFLGLTLQWSKN